MTSPFGIEFHSSIESLDIVNDIGQGKYFVNAPKVHPSFNRYIVQATPRLGVVWIKAISPIFDSDAYGSRVRQAQDELSAQLQKRYGLAKRTDFLRLGSIWTEDRYWTHGLSANERHYFMMWERPAADLPEDLKNIFLGASGYGGDETNFAIEYSSMKAEEAEQELQDDLSNLL